MAAGVMSAMLVIGASGAAAAARIRSVGFMAFIIFY
jgi:hypothetical protein